MSDEIKLPITLSVNLNNSSFFIFLKLFLASRPKLNSLYINKIAVFKIFKAEFHFRQFSLKKISWNFVPLASFSTIIVYFSGPSEKGFSRWYCWMSSKICLMLNWKNNRLLVEVRVIEPDIVIYNKWLSGHSIDILIPDNQACLPFIFHAPIRTQNFEKHFNSKPMSANFFVYLSLLCLLFFWNFSLFDY